MAGRNTSKAFHPSKEGHMVLPVLIEQRDWQTLEDLAGCQFSPAQREAIADELTICRDYRDYRAEIVTPHDVKGTLEQPRPGRRQNGYGDEIVTRQDVKRTLEAISRMQGAEIIEAYNNCDQITDVLIYEAAWFQFEVNVLTCTDANLACETIAKAASFVLANLPESKGGRPPKDHHKRLARFCCELWVQLGNNHIANTWEGNPSPMVEFAQYLFDLVDDHLTDQSTIAERLNEAR